MRAQVRIDFPRHGDGETFLWAWVQAIGDGNGLALGIIRHVRALGQALAQQPIRVLVSAALPEAVGIRKEDPDRQPFVLG